MAIIVGLTGGIGSGKSTIARYFASLGVPVYIADDEAKKMLNTPQAIAEITEALGTDVLTDGLPDRQKIAALVFNDAHKLAQLNGIIHPKVNYHFLTWAGNNSSAPFVIKEAAILFETGSYKNCDKIILVTAPEEMRIRRVMERDNASLEQVKNRIDNQWDDDKKAALSDFIIDNTNLETAKLQALSIFNTLSSQKL